MDDKKQHILIVEDEALIAAAYAKKFELSGFRATVAPDGKRGLELALADHPDCILLDLMMPVMDGWAFLKKLRKDPWGANALVMLLTNVSDVQLVSDRLQYGVFDFLVKSNYTPAEIVEQVANRLHRTTAA